MNRIINIVSLNIPYPANYGGVIDIYYKIKALHDCDVKIILHCFEYERPRAQELENICEEVLYYKRKTGVLANLSVLPYNVYGRKDKRLIGNLLKNDYPILFEGLHTCYYLNDSRLKGRIKIFRECNIEHDYYREIGKAENNRMKKIFYYIEAMRFKWFQSNVATADLSLSVSQTDAAYLQKIFPSNCVEFMPCFHGNNSVSAVPGQSDFILYHGKLSVKENEKAALYLIENIFSKLPDYKCIIAGMNPSKTLLKAASKHANIQVEANPSVERINELISTAQINLLVTFQDTGLKIKLLNSLFTGRYIVVNSMMLTGSGLNELCYVADDQKDMIKICKDLMQKPFTADALELRKKLLFPTFSNEYQAERLINLLSDTNISS
ncbi:MAG: glycosyltransferase family 4 protein [Tannerella sp.]|nr:glycosyltransferase family 4 protein [Tannerella sp.]